jgi:hypothetical protein
MVGTHSTFDPDRAPCGRIVGGRGYREDDDAGLVVFDLYYACGCRLIRHEYHDGSVTTKAVHHGRRHRVLSDEHAEHPF